ncbi:Astra associated protein 1 Asa1 [Lecanora helva]
MSREALPPAQPSFVLRGHSAQIHAIHFTPGNTRLLTADADGWVVSWNLSFKRPAAVWKAHSNSVLGIGNWGLDRIVTHGRDNKLLVWQIDASTEIDLEKTLPVENSALSPRPPWLLHSLTVNTLNFCPFAMCRDGIPPLLSTQKAVKDANVLDPILIAVPNTVDSGAIDIYQLPTERRVAEILADRFITTGMVMTLNIIADTHRIQIAAGYESGHTMVYVQNDPGATFHKLYCAQPHTQPVLSMAISPAKDLYITSSADAVIAKHPLPSCKSIWKTELKPLKLVQTKHSGQQGLDYRSDGRIFATAGWDAHIRVYSAKTMKELAVLKWHKVGCYSTAFAAISTATDGASDNEETEKSPHFTTQITAAESAVSTVQQRRDRKAQMTHWLAAGAKDGKVSLWEIY